MYSKDFEIHELEVGHRFITVYATPASDMLKLGEQVYHKLPKKFKEINRQNMVHVQGDPMIFHPYGDPDNFRDAYSHFHIVYPDSPKVQFALDILYKCYAPDPLKVTLLEDNVLPGTDVPAAREKSKKLLQARIDNPEKTTKELEEGIYGRNNKSS